MQFLNGVAKVGTKFALATIPQGKLVKLTFYHLQQLQANDMVWLLSDDSKELVCKKVTNVSLPKRREGIRLESLQLTVAGLNQSRMRTFLIGEETGLFYIDPLFLHDFYILQEAGEEKPSAEVIDLEEKRGSA